MQARGISVAALIDPEGHKCRAITKIVEIGEGEIMEKKVALGNHFATVPWSQINNPGCYVSNLTGRLFRIPDSALKEGHSPVIDIVGPGGEEVVTYISKNPYAPIDALRLLAADASIQPNF